MAEKPIFVGAEFAPIIARILRGICVFVSAPRGVLYVVALVLKRSADDDPTRKFISLQAKADGYFSVTAATAPAA